MRIFGLCLVKNEADIIRTSLRESLRWCDRIFVFDNGSTDRTWEMVNEMASADQRVLAWRQDGCPFDDALRAEIFRAHRAEARPGDWWCRLDADELYVEDPRAFLASVPRRHHVVWGLWLQYFLTTADLPRFTAADESSPPEMTLETLPHWYQAKGGEARFFRHRDGLVWEGGAWPAHLGVIEPRRIRVRHYQYRSPAQIQRRLDTRRAAAASGWQHFGHSTQEHWRDKIADPSKLQCDEDGADCVIDSHELSAHIERPWQRCIKLAMHGLNIWP